MMCQRYAQTNITCLFIEIKTRRVTFRGIGKMLVSLLIEPHLFRIWRKILISTLVDSSIAVATNFSLIINHEPKLKVANLQKQNPIQCLSFKYLGVNIYICLSNIKEDFLRKFSRRHR